MPKWACFSQFAAHFTNPFTVCGQMASQLLAVFISSFAVILQCVQKGHYAPSVKEYGLDLNVLNLGFEKPSKCPKY